MTRAPRKASSKRGPARSRPGLAGVLFGLAALAAILGGGALAFLFYGPGPGPHEGGVETTVVLEHGLSLPRISQDLAEAGVIRLPIAFALLAKLTGGGQHLIAGEYAVPAKASTADILAMIRAGRIVHHYITIPEGLSSAQVADVLNASPVLVGHAPAAREGWVMPQTYDVTRGQDRDAVLGQMTLAQARLVQALWANRRPGLPYKSPEQALALASIVEKETALPAERPHVAGVYLNRLAKGMRLESDPTIIYGLTKGRPLGRSLTHADVVQPTAWNTYVIDGLPPTPIANPGRASIEAALNPLMTDDLYFVADGTGGHVFARTFEEHQKNVARWRDIARSLKGDKPGAGG